MPFNVVTSYGSVPISGHIHKDPHARPTLLVVGGAFPPRDFKHELINKYPGANVIILNLPGMEVPWLIDERLETISLAFDEVATRLVGDSPVVALGVSTGCLVVLGLKSANIKHYILDEPYLSTGGLWPLVSAFREMLTKYPGNHRLRNFLSEIFGLTAEEFPGRDWRHLAENIRVPCDVVVGGLQLEPERQLDSWPSFTSHSDREYLTSVYNSNLHVGGENYGHVFGMSSPGRKMIEAIALSALLGISVPSK